jgi:hypothetical protein
LISVFLLVNFSPIYPTGRYMGSHMNTTLTISDSDNRDPISSAILKATHRGKSPMGTNTNSFPTHSYYTRSKSVHDFVIYSLNSLHFYFSHIRNIEEKI